jgi:hypothetical protein
VKVRVKPSGFMHGGSMKKVIPCIVISMLILARASADEPQQPKRPGGPVALNVLVGFGLGSFILGDPFGGTIQGVSELVAGVMLLPAMFEVGEDVLSFLLFPFFGTPSISDASYYLLEAGMVVLLAARIFGIVRPILYAARHNAELQGPKVTVGIIPKVEPCAYRVSSTLGIRLELTFAVE